MKDTLGCRWKETLLRDLLQGTICSRFSKGRTRFHYRMHSSHKALAPVPKWPIHVQSQQTHRRQYGLAMTAAHLATAGLGMFPEALPPQSEGTDVTLPPVLLRYCPTEYGTLLPPLLLPSIGSGCPRGSRNLTAASLSSITLPPSRLYELAAGAADSC